MSTKDEKAKLEKIHRMLEMQRQFMAYDKAHGMDMQDYFAPSEDHPLHGYREAYMELALEVVDDAHSIKGSKRD